MDYYTAMKIAYDMSVLAVGHVLPISRTGTHRVTWALAQALARNEAVDFQSCWAHGVDPFIDHDDPVLNQVRAWDRHRLRLGTPWVGAWNSAWTRWFPLTLNALRLPLLMARWDAESNSRLAGSGWDDVQILHSMAYPLPCHSRVKRVLTLHDAFPVTNPEWFEPQARWHFQQLLKNARHADAILCPSEATKAALLENTSLDPEQLWVIPWGVSDDFLNAAQDDSESTVLAQWRLQSQRYVLCVATLEPRKNLQRSVEAYLLWRREHPEVDIPLVLVGPSGWRMPHSWLIRQLKPNEADWVRLTGFCDDSILATLYRHATVLLYASLAEGFGLPILEAMACGCPVITSNTSSMPEVAKNQAILVDPLDVRAIANGLNQVMRSADRPSDALKVHAAQFSWNATAEQLVQRYQQLF